MINTNIGYGYNDLCIVPGKVSNISSRSECNPFYANDKLPIFASPMASVVNVANFHLWEREHITPVLPRNIDYNIRLDYIKQGKWVALSLSEFEELILGSDEFMNNMSVIPHICVDLANGHMQKLISVCAKAKHKYNDNIVLMTGNIANPETYREYCDAHIDYVRCSIGSGSCCTTASNTAVHYPIASLIDEINTIKKSRKHIYESAYDKFCTKVIADGGIRNYNDVIKALALGADYVMVGGLFATFIESAGVVTGFSTTNEIFNLIHPDYFEKDMNIILKHIDADYLFNKVIVKGEYTSLETTIFDNLEGIDVIKTELNDYNQYYYIIDLYNDEMTEFTKRFLISYNIEKQMYGMSTKTAQRLIKSDSELKTAEGIEKTIKVKYTMKQWVENMIAYLRSTMSYCGCTTLSQFIGNVTLKVQSPSEIYSVNK